MLKGIVGSEGYGIGNVVIVKEPNLNFVNKSDCDPKNEKKRFNDALEKFCELTERQAINAEKNIGKVEAQIISGHISMIKDPYMYAEIEKLMDGGQCAEGALQTICDMFITVFSSADDELTKQRAADVKDIKNAMLGLLLKVKEINLNEIAPNTVILTHELTPSMTAGMNKENVVGIITETGGTTSHAAILARAMEIPAVLGVKNATALIEDGAMAVVDGLLGEVHVNPDTTQRDKFIRLRAEYFAEKKALAKYIGKETLTADGEKKELCGNIGNADDADRVLNSDGEGVGLFRTEFLFLDRSQAPGEEEQFNAYKKVALTMKNKPVIIRTLDIGGDKEIPYLGMKKEENPFLGFRAVRYCLRNKELFRIQLRALVRASAYGDIRVMVPLVTGIDELESVQYMIKVIMAELDGEKIDYNKNLKIGVMIETPAAALMADVLAEKADFFSIGTNDLVQYTMAVDRGNDDVSYLYSAFNPAVLRSIKHIIECAKEKNIPVGMCGEAAADKFLIPLLISFGLDEFSVSPSAVLKVRKEISRWSKPKADEICNKVLKMTKCSEIIDFLHKNA